MSKRWSKKVTHMVWHDGRQEYLKRAEMQKVKIVNVLWIDHQEERGVRLSEENYPAIQSCPTPKRFKDHAQKTPGTPEIVRKKRILGMVKLGTIVHL